VPPHDVQLVIFAAERCWSRGRRTRVLREAAAYARRYGVFVFARTFYRAGLSLPVPASPRPRCIGVVARVTPCTWICAGVFAAATASDHCDAVSGRAALIVDTDIYFPQVARAAVAAGAQLLLFEPICSAFDFTPDKNRVRRGERRALECRDGRIRR
jgi:hypothetical protein